MFVMIIIENTKSVSEIFIGSSFGIKGTKLMKLPITINIDIQIISFFVNTQNTGSATSILCFLNVFC